MVSFRRAFIVPALVVVFTVRIAAAGSATWQTSPVSPVWNTDANWSPATIPDGPTDVATFGSTDLSSALVALTASTQVGEIVFNADAHGNDAAGYEIVASDFTLTILGAGITNNSSLAQQLRANGATGVLLFENSASAGVSSDVFILADGGGKAVFTGSSTAGDAILFANDGGIVDISGLTSAGMTAGAIYTGIDGANVFNLGSKTLTVGTAQNLNYMVTGVIADGGISGGTGGSFVKTGEGELILSGSTPNTYTGATYVNGGTLTLRKTGGAAAILGSLVIGDGIGGAAVLNAENEGNLAAGLSVVVNSDGTFETAFAESIGTLQVNRGIVDFGPGLTLGGQLSMVGGSITGSGSINLSTDLTQAISDANGTAAVIMSGGAINLTSASPHEFDVSAGPGAVDLRINSQINGGTAIVKSGAGVMVLGATSNGYTGGTAIKGGVLSVSFDAALGAVPMSPVSDNLAFDGGILRADASFTLSGNRGITLNAGGGSVEVPAGLDVTYDGVISGSGDFTKTGLGGLTFTNVAKTSTGTTTVNEGILNLSGVTSFAGPVVVGDGLGAADSVSLTMDGMNQLGGASPLTVQSDGLLLVDTGSQDTVATLSVAAGHVQINATGSLTASSLTMTGGAISDTGSLKIQNSVTATSDAGGQAATIAPSVDLLGDLRTFTVNDGPGDEDLVVTGTIGNGGVTKMGAGTLRLAGTNTYDGLTTVVQGTLLLTGSIVNSDTFVANGATLRGQGSVGALTIDTGASLAPGATVGTLDTMNLTINPGTFLFFDLSVPGVIGNGLNDLIGVNGDLTLDGTLSVNELAGFGYGTFTIIEYSGMLTEDNGLEIDPAFLSAYPGSTIAIDSATKRVNLVVVPEPGTFMLLLAAGAIGLVMRGVRFDRWNDRV